MQPTRILLVIACALACGGKREESASPPNALAPLEDPTPSTMTILAGRAELERLLSESGIELVLASADRKQLDTSACDVTTDMMCMRCELAAESTLLPYELASSLAIAPVAFLKAAGLRRIVACSKLTYLGDHGTAPLGSVDFARGALLVQTTAMTQHARGVLQHEIYHLFDIEHGTRDRAWQRLNPAGFRYGTAGKRGGFARPYGMKNAAEDKATVYEAIVMRDLCALAVADRVLLAKGRLVRERIRAAIGDEAKFVDELAPCLAQGQ